MLCCHVCKLCAVLSAQKGIVKSLGEIQVMVEDEILDSMH